MFPTKRFKTTPYSKSHKFWSKRLIDFADILFKPLLFKIKSFVKDDFDFLKKCDRNFTKNSKLVTFDVTILNTNMLHELGLKAIEYW